MTIYYLDTSALVKRYVNESGSEWLRAQLMAQPQPTVIIVDIGVVEMISALNRRRREKTLTLSEYQKIRDAFQSDCLNEYSIINIVDNLVVQANQLLEAHPLRAYDAIHLAAAIVVNRQLVSNNFTPLTFVSADNQLNDAASIEGLLVDNPNDHP